jgi:hypothetical protein
MDKINVVMVMVGYKLLHDLGSVGMNHGCIVPRRF